MVHRDLMTRTHGDHLPSLCHHAPDTEEEGRWFTDHSVVEVIGQHPLTHGNQQPKGFFFLGVQQQHGGQDVHRLLRGSQKGQLLTRPHDGTETLKLHNTQARAGGVTWW